MQPAVAHRAARIVEAHEGGDRNFRIRRVSSGSPALSGDGSNSCRERSADTGLAIGVAEPAHLQVRERYEFGQMISAVVESCRVDSSRLERSKRQT